MSKIWFSKPMAAYYDIDCEECGNSILEEDDFYFFKEIPDSSSIKVCPECKSKLEDLALTEEI